MKILKKIAIVLFVIAVIIEFVLPNSLLQVKLFVQSFSIVGGIVLIYVSGLPMWKE